MADLAEKLHVDLTVVGPELPLSLGIADEFIKRELPIFGPTRLAAQIESSKVFSKEFFWRHKIPTADAIICQSADEARRAIKKYRLPGGPQGRRSGRREGRPDRGFRGRGRAARSACSSRSASSARPATGSSSRSSCAGRSPRFWRSSTAEVCVPLPTARDYKKVYDGDRGPNTGGMGAHSPAGVLNADTASQVLRDILWPTFKGLQAEGRGFKGVLYAGLMVTESGPKVLEYNARFGDPETEVILPRVTSDMADVMLATAHAEASNGSCRSRSRTRPAWASCSAANGYPGNVRARKAHHSDWPTRRGCPESSSSTPARLATATVS